MDQVIIGCFHICTGPVCNRPSSVVYKSLSALGTTLALSVSWEFWTLDVCTFGVSIIVVVVAAVGGVVVVVGGDGCCCCRNEK